MSRPYKIPLFLWIALVTLPIFLGSCSGGSQGTADDDPQVLTKSEIEELIDVGDAYTLIQHYEPKWLRKRGQGSLNRPNEVVVYLDENRQGGPSTLRQISITNVERIEYLPPSRATMEFGSGHANGAIMVYMKQGKQPRSQ